MASAWGVSFGGAWGAAWGAIRLNRQFCKISPEYSALPVYAGYSGWDIESGYLAYEADPSWPTYSINGSYAPWGVDADRIGATIDASSIAFLAAPGYTVGSIEIGSFASSIAHDFVKTNVDSEFVEWKVNSTHCA